MLRIRELRESQNIQQKELATKLNIGFSTLSQYETGKRFPDYETLLKIADFFGVTTDFLLGRSNQKDKPVPPEEDELAKLLEDPETREFYELIKDFSDDELDDLLNYGQYLIAKRDSKKKP